MKICLKELKSIIRENLKSINEAHFGEKVDILITDEGEHRLIDPEYGKIFSTDASRWGYKDYFKFFRENDIDFANVETEYGKTRKDNWIKDGFYRRRDFLNKLRALPKKAETFKIAKGKPLVPTEEFPKHRKVNTLYTKKFEHEL